MRKVRNVLRIVEGCRCRRTLVGTFPVTGLTGENTWVLVGRGVSMNMSDAHLLVYTADENQRESIAVS